MNTNTKPVVSIEQVSSVYSGIDGACCCGCKGKHTYSSKHRIWASKNRGYAVGDDEVNDRVVARVVNKLNAQHIVDLTIDSDLVSTVIDKRVYIAYLKH